MGKKIFDGAKFGDPFLTRGGRIAKFICITKITEDNRYCLYVENEQVPIWYNEKGESLLNKEKLNIVSNCQEPIDETELNTLAEQYESSLPDSYTWNEQCDDGEGIHGVCSVCEIEKAFKAGYKKAKE